MNKYEIASSLIEEIKNDVNESIKDANKDKNVDNNYDKSVDKEKIDKVENAIDYSDENEMAEDLTIQEEIEKEEEEDKDDAKSKEDNAKFNKALSELVFKMPTAPISKPITATTSTQKLKLEDDDYDSISDNNDKPDLNDKSIASNDKLNLIDSSKKQQQQKDTIVNNKQEIAIANENKNDSTKTNDDKSKASTCFSTTIAITTNESLLNKKRLNTPLAEMLPSKYENSDVTEFFPEFRVDKTLRFSRLFGPGKSSLMPNPWKSVKCKKRKKKRQLSENKDLDASKENDNSKKEQSSSSSPNDNETAIQSISDEQQQQQQQQTNSSTNKTDSEFQLKFAETFNENDVEEDQEDLLKRDLECKTYLNSDENLDGDLAQKMVHWRNGPAAYWYNDMFVPDASKIFEFGFKKRQDKMNNEDDSEDEENSFEEDDDLSDHSLEDCYHMVTQGSWEDEIIWNGEECKQKILAKNAEKYNVAGWVREF